MGVIAPASRLSLFVTYYIDDTFLLYSFLASFVSSLTQDRDYIAHRICIRLSSSGVSINSS